MESFYFIAQKIMNPNIEPFFYTNDFTAKFQFALRLQSEKETRNHNIFHNFFYEYVLHENRKISKFHLLKSIYANMFFPNELKENMLNLFCSIQRTNGAFSRLAYIYKFKKAETMIKDDMFLNPIEATDKTTITIYDSQNGSKYLFSITDLIQIIKKSLIHSPNFFSDPLECKNPYTNIAFNKSTLYNIYFFIRHKNYVMPQVIQKFFLSNFDLENFSKNNLFYIREEAIKDYANNLQPRDVAGYVDIMLKNYLKKKIYIHPDFPKNVLGNIMRPYLYYYLIATNSLCFEKRHEYSKKLLLKFDRFFRFNPNFGKKYLKLDKPFCNISKHNPFYVESIHKAKKIFVFDDKHVDFHEKEKKESFLTSHLKPNDLYYNNTMNGDDEDDYSLTEASEYSSEDGNENQSQTVLQPNIDNIENQNNDSNLLENEVENEDHDDNRYSPEIINEMILMELGLINQVSEEDDE